MPCHRDDHGIAFEIEEAPVFLAGAAGDQAFRGGGDGETVLLEVAVERKMRLPGHLPVETDSCEQIRREDGAMPCDSLAVDEPKPVDEEKPLVRRIGQALGPTRRLERKKPVRRDVTRRFDRLREAQHVARRTPQRRFGDEGAAALAARYQPLVDELLHGSRDREPADAPVLRELRFARNAGAGTQFADLLLQTVGNLQIERAATGPIL
jgi:hypothetical protein